MQTEYIDEHLPFSEEEFYRAFRLVESDRKAREGAAFVVQVVREANERAERVRLASVSGSQDGGTAGVPCWVIGDGAFALLALVSDDLRVRADAYMRAQWEAQREQWLRNGLYRPGGVILREPTAEVYAEVESRVAAEQAEWRALCETTRAEIEKRRRRRNQPEP